jgi:hypothetical protein
MVTATMATMVSLPGCVRRPGLVVGRGPGRRTGGPAPNLGAMSTGKNERRTDEARLAERPAIGCVF